MAGHGGGGFYRGTIRNHRHSYRNSIALLHVNIRLTFHTLILCNDILHFMFLVIVCMFYFISYSMID